MNMAGNLTTPFSGQFVNTTFTPNPSNGTEGMEHDMPLGERKWFIILKYTLYAIIFLISFFGNILVCYVVSRRMKHKTVTSYFIMNLAVADLLYTFWPINDYSVFKTTLPKDI